MSRYRLQHPARPHVHIDYGFDRMLDHYFYVVTDNNPAIPEKERDPIGRVLSGDPLLGSSRDDVLAALRDFGLPNDHPHINALIRDEPF